MLCEFRARLLAGDAAERLLACMLDVAQEAGLLKARGRQRTDSTHVLAAVRAERSSYCRDLIPTCIEDHSLA